jgi:hypothetical protein
MQSPPCVWWEKWHYSDQRLAINVEQIHFTTVKKKFNFFTSVACFFYLYLLKVSNETFQIPQSIRN